MADAQFIDLTANVQGVLPLANGGTNNTLGNAQNLAGGAGGTIPIQTAPSTTTFLSGTGVLQELGSSFTLTQSPIFTTLNGLDASTNAANDAFVQAAIQYTMATKPLNLGATGGGTYSFAGVGTGAVIVWNSSGGALTSSLTIATPGSGFKVGDLIRPLGGNNDATARVQTVSGTGITGVLVLYGGTGYPGPVTGNTNNSDSSTYPFTFTITGTLTSNATFIATPGTFITQSNQWDINNNTTGAFSLSWFQSGQSGGISTDTPIGTGVVIPQGTNSNCSTLIQSDGVTDIWKMSQSLCSAGSGTVTSVSVTTANGFSGTVANPTTTPAISLSISGAITPTTTGGIVGTTLADNANAGSVGEFQTATNTVSLSSGVSTNITSVLLGAGDWDISASVTFTGGVTTSTSTANSGVSNTSSVLPGVPMQQGFYLGVNFTNALISQTSPTVRDNLSVATTVFCVVNSIFSVSTETASCIMNARRAR
jgi:hypothetical protein